MIISVSAVRLNNLFQQNDSVKPPYFCIRFHLSFHQKVFDLLMFQTVLSYEVDRRNYDLHDGILSQNFTAEDMLMNGTVKII
jgi:hypothetical protein